MEKNISNNIFYYGPSELSQDAFICWFLSFLLKENDGLDADVQNCAREFMKTILPDFSDSDFIDEIRRQVYNIDVLLKVGDRYIIVEDKTFTSTHDNQINQYKGALVEKGIDAGKIICVYYKIVEQSKPETDADVEIKRTDLLQLFGKHSASIGNAIFHDYYRYLMYIDSQVNEYKSKPIAEWSGYAYMGFFTNLKTGFLKDYNSDWHYVPNPTGGFMGMWWSVANGGRNVLDIIGIGTDIVDELYPQIEDNIIAIKISEGSNKEKKNLTTEFRWKVYRYFKEVFGEQFKKKVFRPGKYMTAGYIEYNETNYEEVISKVNDAIINMPSKLK